VILRVIVNRRNKQQLKSPFEEIVTREKSDMERTSSHRSQSMKKINSKPKFLNLVNKDQSAQSLPRSASQNGNTNTLHENKVLDEKAKVHFFSHLCSVIVVLIASILFLRSCLLTP
jgi:hypothetical protein